jgi:hypothetical protein
LDDLDALLLQCTILGIQPKGDGNNSTFAHFNAFEETAVNYVLFGLGMKYLTQTFDDILFQSDF